MGMLQGWKLELLGFVNSAYIAEPERVLSQSSL